MRLRVALILAVLVAVALPSPASASELIDRNASQVSLKVARNGQALAQLHRRRQAPERAGVGRRQRDPRDPLPQQVEFRLDYSGGWGTFKRDVWKRLQNACHPYDGPALQWLVAACKAPDGSYWAVQAWQRMLPNYGLPAHGASAVWELRLSHWSGDAARAGAQAELGLPPLPPPLRLLHLPGQARARLPLDAAPACRSTPSAETSTSTPSTRATATGWRRENSFLVHKPTGMFCYGFYSHGSRPAGAGQRYRATVIGPGVTPDVTGRARRPAPTTRSSTSSSTPCRRSSSPATRSAAPV